MKLESILLNKCSSLFGSTAISKKKRGGGLCTICYACRSYPLLLRSSALSSSSFRFRDSL